MSKQAGLYDQRDGDFEGSSAAFMVDSGCIAASGLFFGTSPCTPFVGEFLVHCQANCLLTLPRTFRICGRYLRRRQDWPDSNRHLLLVLHRHLLLAHSQQLAFVVHRLGLDSRRKLNDAKCRQHQLGLHR
jgi:hypothetical protein